MSTPQSQLYRTILESLPAAVYVVDRERRILLWNGQAEKISGYMRHEVIGRACHEGILMHCNEHGTILCGEACPLRGTMHDGRPREVEVYMQHKLGHRVPVRVRAVVVRNDSGSIIGAAEVFEEIAAVPGRVLDRPSIETLLHLQCVDYGERRIPFGILLIQIEGPRRAERMYGRPAEDEMTAELTATVAQCMRREDRLGRWSENRLMAILPNCWPPALTEAAESLRELLAQTTVPWWGDRLKIAVKVGRADMRDGDSAETLVARCEKAIEA
jgi:PAS domain S-box-containing protein